MFFDYDKNIKLGDMGLAKNIKSVTVFNSQEYTLSYLSPEVVKGKNFSVTSDMW
jgi:serine/threonine protein kinase